MEFWILVGIGIVLAIVINAGKNGQAEKEPPASNGRIVVRGKALNHDRHSSRRKMMLRLSILALIGLTGGVTAVLWCRRIEATYCAGAWGLIATGVLALIGIIELYRRRP